ncbi:MAG: Npt1/Npt2 family nucleotide transporter [Chlamydiota bacterium]
MAFKEAHEFGRLRSFLWPVHTHEYRKFIPMLLIYFLICFNYTILRAAKDALVITAPASGAEALPFIKVWAILPMALLMTFIFTRLSNKYKREHVFYIMMGIFLGFFTLFATVIYPFRDALHPHVFADKLQTLLPNGFSGFIAIFRNWTFTAFYVMSEMWSTMIMSVLFWSFANEVTSIRDARRFYTLFLIGANIACCAAGVASVWISEAGRNLLLPFGTDPWGQSTILLCGMVVILGLITCAGFRWLNVKGYGYSAKGEEEEKESKMGLRNNFSYIAKSKYLIYIAIIVVGYNIAINLTEVVWKDQMKQLYSTPNDFNAYMGKVLRSMGLISTTIAVIISGNMIRKLSWTFSALIPPVILAITGIGFFTFLFFRSSNMAQEITSFFHSTPLVLCVFFGSMQNCLSRASKFTFFDATKEMAFIPLSRECKLKGKAAIDGIGSRLGKSGSSIIHQSLLMLTGSVALSTPYVAIVFLAAIGGWILAVRSLGTQFQTLTSKDTPTTTKPAEATI